MSCSSARALSFITLALVACACTGTTATAPHGPAAPSVPPPAGSQPAPTAVPPPPPGPAPTHEAPPEAGGLELVLVPASLPAGGSVVVQIRNAGHATATLHEPGGSNGCAVREGHAVTLRGAGGFEATSFVTPIDAACTMVFVPPTDVPLAPGQVVEWTRIDTSRIFPTAGGPGLSAPGSAAPLAPGRFTVVAQQGLSATLELR